MRTIRSLSFFFLAALLGCTTGTDGQDPTDPTDPKDPVDPVDPTALVLSGAITADMDLTGAIELTGDATIEAGVTVTVAAGSTFTAAEGTALKVEGSFSVLGTAASAVSMNPVSGAMAWNGLSAEAGGSVDIHYATGTAVATLLNCRAGAATCVLEGIDFTEIGQVIVAEDTALIDKSRVEQLKNAGVSVRGGDLTIRDTYLLTSDHDIVVVSGGTLTVEYSEIGGAQGSYEHCNLHIGSADAVSITNSNIISAIYGIMIGGTSNAVITNNNFMSNDPGNDILEVGTVSNIDLSQNYWDQTAPTGLGAAYDVSAPVTAQITAAGPRN